MHPRVDSMISKNDGHWEGKGIFLTQLPVTRTISISNRRENLRSPRRNASRTFASFNLSPRMLQMLRSCSSRRDAFKLLNFKVFRLVKMRTLSGIAARRNDKFE